MPDLKCPVCGGLLQKTDKTLRCPAGHSYDIAKQGYVNLLMSNKSSAKRHGDDRAMVRARTCFLEKGYYDPLRDTISDAAVKYCGEKVELLDAGCGEGWYASGVKGALEAAGKSCRVCGIDISREALIAFAKRDREATLSVAGINALPVPDGSCDLILNIFAPCDDGEFLRVLKPGGILIRAVPLEDHLLGLKKAVYDKPYLNTVCKYSPDGFLSLETVDIRRVITLESREDVHSLFMMTPYYYKTGREDQNKLAALDRLETEISFRVTVHKKKYNYK